MKKTILLLILTFLYSLSFAEPGDKREYKVDRITGLNVVTDSIDIPPEEALDLENFVLDKFGALHKRFGIKNWNDSLVSADSIKDIHYVEDKNGDKMLFIATNNYIYEAKSWEDVDSMETWDSLNVNGTGTIVDYTMGAIDSVKSRYVYADTGDGGSGQDSTSWSMVVALGDRFMIGDSIYVIDSVLSDYVLFVSGLSTPSEVDDTIGTATYRILKYINGVPQLSSWNGNLYVADSRGDPWWYDGDQPYLLGVVDSGTVSTADVVDTSAVAYETGTARLEGGSNIIQLVGADITDTAFTIGNTFHAQYRSEARNPGIPGGRKLYDFSARITGVDTLSPDTAVYLHRAVNWRHASTGIVTDMPDIVFLPDTIENRSERRWWIDHIYLRHTTRQYQYFEDTTKFFPAGKEMNYEGFWVVSGDNALKRGIISANTDRVVSFDSTGVSFAAGDRYYIAWQLPEFRQPIINQSYEGDYPNPFNHADTSYVEMNYFHQIIFHRNRLYAIGFSIVPKAVEGFSVGDTINTGRVWFSRLAIPNRIPSDFNFDLAGASRNDVSLFSQDAAEVMYELRDDFYVATGSNIYRISGEPDPGPEDLYLSQVIQGVGTNQRKGIVTTKDNVAYIMNQEAIWFFDGNTIQKISYKIDPLVERYRNSRMTAGKFKDNIFFSYPDSNITIVMHDPTKGFTNWDIGMLTINDQSVAIDSNYFLFSRVEDSAYVLQYPRNNSTFTDILGGVSELLYTVSYRSGWQSMGPWDYARKLNWFYMPYSQSTGNTEVFFFADGDLTDTLQIDTVSATGMILHRTRLNDVRGNFHQVFIKSNSGGDITLSGYKIECQDTRKER